VGSPLANVEVRISPGGAPGQPESGSDDGETGEICVRGPSVFTGYWPGGEGGPNADGWLGTGDVGYFDADGDLHLVDRRADLILVSGFNVYPREVEDVIDAMPGVMECAVRGVPHPQSGEAVKAFVVLASQAEIRAEDVVAWCEQRLARYKCPTIVQFVPELPHGAAGKIARAQLS
jgi:long-chain acyl-CoA synthetase